MAAKVIEYNGKKQSVSQWAKETGLSSGTIGDRLKLGWSVERALSVAPDSVANRVGAGRHLYSGITASYLKVWRDCGKEEFERQLVEAFKKDALKVVSQFQFLLPKNNEASLNEKPQCAVQINNILPESEFQHFKPLNG